MFNVASVAAYQNNVIMLILDKVCLLEMASSQAKDHMHPSDLHQQDSSKLALTWHICC